MVRIVTEGIYTLIDCVLGVDVCPALKPVVGCILEGAYVSAFTVREHRGRTIILAKTCGIGEVESGLGHNLVVGIRQEEGVGE